MQSTNLEDLLTLKKIPNLGDSSIKKLIRAVGDPSQIFKEKPNDLLKIDGIGHAKIKELHNTKYRHAATNELKYIVDNDIQHYVYDMPNYPARLSQCADGPVVLFSSGNINLENQRMISIVGTRKVTSQGIQFCEELIEEIAPFDPVIVSGFAYGVDITAHRAAIKNNLQTIGCLAHGLNQIYPKPHKKYVNDVEANGGFFTDFWSTDTFDRKNFLARNRIIAGLSEATLVIESADKGGSLVTADIANSYDRDVFAVPGRPTDTMSKGCNMLIKTQRAQMITSAADLVYMLNWDVPNTKQNVVQKQLFVALEPKEQHIYDYLQSNNKQQLDAIAIGCDIPIFKMASVLLKMELKGVIRPLPGKVFEAV